MPTPTYKPIAWVSPTTSVSQISFNFITQNYRDLILVGSGMTSTAAGVVMKLNGDTGSNYYQLVMYGDGGSVYATGAGSVGTAVQIGRFDNSYRAQFELHIMDYTHTGKTKGCLNRYGGPTVLSAARTIRWNSTAAITNIVLTPESGTFQAGSTFTLYGINA